MTAKQFQSEHGPELKKFLESNTGKQFLNLLSALRPAYEFPVHEHLMIANREAIRGYESCLLKIVALTMPPTTPVQPEANYGVPDKTVTKE